MGRRRTAIYVILGSTAIVAGCSVSGAQADAPLSSLVIASVHGFVLSPHGDPNDLPQMPGPLAIAGAASSSCDGVSQTTLRQDGWKASYLRVWVDRTKTPRAYIDLCISQMANTSDGTKNYREVLGSTNPKQVEPVTKIPVPNVPGAHAFSLTGEPLSFAEFSKGRYVVTMEAYEVPIPQPPNSHPAFVYARVPIPVASIATKQYSRLPG
jgi:hypothetical protein